MRDREPLRFTSCQAPIAESLCTDVSAYVARRLGRPTELVNDVAWPERLWCFRVGRVHVCWMCGLPYAWLADRARADMELLAAP